MGTNLVVGDDSLKIAIGGIFLTNVPVVRDNHFLEIDLFTNDLKALAPGAYELDVITSGGRGVLSNAVQIATKPPEIPTNAPVITQVPAQTRIALLHNGI